MSKFFTFLLLLLILSGCTPIRVIDIDPEKIEEQQIAGIVNKQKYEDPFATEKTAKHVIVANEDDIMVTVDKVETFIGKQGIRLERWEASIANFDTEPKCVIVGWNLMDFVFDSEYPTEILVPPNDKFKFASFKQTPWSFDGETFIALPPSGYVSNMRIREPDVNNNNTVVCDEQIEEDDIVER